VTYQRRSPRGSEQINSTPNCTKVRRQVEQGEKVARVPLVVQSLCRSKSVDADEGGAIDERANRLRRELKLKNKIFTLGLCQIKSKAKQQPKRKR
jgi:hypothetical protein